MRMKVSTFSLWMHYCFVHFDAESKIVKVSRKEFEIFIDIAPRFARPNHRLYW